MRYSQVLLDNNISIYLNTNENIERPIIISIFLSFDNPWEHEWNKIIAYKEGEKYENKIREEFKFENYDKYMISAIEQKTFYISLDDIKYLEKNDDFNSKIIDIELVDISQFYNIFHKNYIGFKNNEELQKFKKFFNMNDYKDNPLYKISTVLFPSLTTFVVFILIFFVLLVLYIFIFLKIYVTFFFDMIFTSIISIVYIPIYLSHLYKFKKLEFNFDPQIQKDLIYILKELINHFI